MCPWPPPMRASPTPTSPRPDAAGGPGDRRDAARADPSGPAGGARARTGLRRGREPRRHRRGRSRRARRRRRPRRNGGEVAPGHRRAAGLGNVTLDVGDVLEFTDGELGEFDYVIVHGLYAWAPAHVREAVLASCRSPPLAHGHAYLSYTAHPGGHMRQMLREIAQSARARLQEPLERAERARGLFTLLDQLGESAGPSISPASWKRTCTRSPPRPTRCSCTTCSARPTRLWRHRPRRHRDRPELDGQRRDAFLEQPPSAWSPARLRLRRRRACRPRSGAASSTTTCCVMPASSASSGCCATPTAAPRRGSTGRRCRGLLVALDGDEAPETVRAALVDGPVPFATLREPAAGGVEADALAEDVVQGCDAAAGGEEFHVVPSPASPVAGTDPRASGLARSRRGRVGGDDAAQPGRADHRRADRRVVAVARRHPQPRGDPRGVSRRARRPLADAALAKFAELGLLHA